MSLLHGRGPFIFISMQLLKQGSTGTIKATLAELSTLAAPFYLFIFSYPSGPVVTLVISSADDIIHESLQYRKNEFEVPADLFDGQPTGIWSYKVYEQASAINVDPAQALTLVERGLLKLTPATDAVPLTEYDPADQTRTVYNG